MMWETQRGRVNDNGLMENFLHQDEGFSVADDCCFGPSPIGFDESPLAD